MSYNLIMKIFFSLIGGVCITLGIIFYFIKNEKIEINNEKVSTDVNVVIKQKNIGWLAKYNFENLRKRGGISSEINEIGNVLIVEEARKEVLKKYKEKNIIKINNFESKTIEFVSNGKKISGMMNIPITPMSNKMPIIIMVRGYAESEGYFIGSGSWKAADELARNGFITISLDFLGYGNSNMESTDILEARFEKAVSLLDLIESVKKLNNVDINKIGIWSHSNGGQITMSVLEITGEKYPTVMWAPMTKPFPESIISTMDESEAGKIVKAKVEDFENDYDSRLYSIDNYYDWIKAPILIHQGTEDEWCKVEWQETLKSKILKLGGDIELDVRKNNDHNLKQNRDEVIDMDIKFYKEKFQI